MIDLNIGEKEDFQKIVENAIESAEDYELNMNEACDQIADDYVGGLERNLTILENSTYSPSDLEWELYTPKYPDYKDIIEAMAYSVLRQELYEALV